MITILLLFFFIEIFVAIFLILLDLITNLNHLGSVFLKLMHSSIGYSTDLINLIKLNIRIDIIFKVGLFFFNVLFYLIVGLTGFLLGLPSP